MAGSGKWAKFCIRSAIAEFKPSGTLRQAVAARQGGLLPREWSNNGELSELAIGEVPIPHYDYCGT
jgi:hypothetical protein